MAAKVFEMNKRSVGQRIGAVGNQLGDVVVGWTVPPSVQLRTISSAVVNGHRLIVSLRTRKVIGVFE